MTSSLPESGLRSKPPKGSCCFLGQETLSSLLSCKYRFERDLRFIKAEFLVSQST